MAAHHLLHQFPSPILLPYCLHEIYWLAQASLRSSLPLVVCFQYRPQARVTNLQTDYEVRMQYFLMCQHLAHSLSQQSMYVRLTSPLCAPIHLSMCWLVADEVFPISSQANVFLQSNFAVMRLCLSDS